MLLFLAIIFALTGHIGGALVCIALHLMLA